MKSFINFLTEDIVGSVFWGKPAAYYDKSTINTKEKLFSVLDKSHSQYEYTNHEKIPLNDEYHARVHRDSGDDNRRNLTVTLHPNEPKHQHHHVMTYTLGVKDKPVIDENGVAHTAYEGFPKKRFDYAIKKGVIKIPSNLIHKLSNHLNSAIISGDAQSPGGINFWKNAIKHGSSTKKHVKILSQKSPSDNMTSIGKATLLNRKDVYTGRVTKKGKPSNVDIDERFNRRLAVFPSERE